MHIRTKQIALFSILGIFLLASYQNCAADGFIALQVEDTDLSSLNPPGPGGTGVVTDTGFIYPQDTVGRMFSSYDECRNNDAEYDACIFLKNPVYRKGSAFESGILSYGTNLNAYQSFGVKLKNLDGTNTLSSTKNLMVYYTGNDATRSPFQSDNPTAFQLSLNNGKKFQAYQNDGGASSTGTVEKATAQVMAYVWIQHLGEELGRRTGINWTENKLIGVDAWTTDSRYGGLEKRNAFYQGYFSNSNPGQAGAHEIVMGYATGSDGSNRHEMALSAEVYLHEMGHGNLFQAAGGAIYQDSNNSKFEIVITKCTGATGIANTRRIVDNTQIQSFRAACGGDSGFEYSVQNTFCKTNMGCIDAMNEGQADFHYLMIFPNATALGETITNTLEGLISSKLYLPGSPGGSSCGAVDTNKPVVPRDVNGAIPGFGRAEDYYVGSALQYNTQTSSGIVRCGMDVPGEIHGMGSLYAKILWDIYKASANKRSFERTFQRTLASYTASSTFSTARSFLLADDLALEGGINQTVINNAFSGKGIP